MDKSRAPLQRQGSDGLGAGQRGEQSLEGESGDLVNEPPGANLKSTRKFEDFKLHLEYNCPEEGNSGIYLRGRYEVQIEYEQEGTDDRFHKWARSTALSRRQ